jgi:Glutathione S-transferase N-terminal domain
MHQSGAPPTTVYRASPGSGTHVWSPFVIKLETRLRLDGIKYATAAGSMSDAPRGKFPYVTILRGDDSGPVSLADSTLIIQRLAADGTLRDLNASLSPEDRARDLALRALFEDRLYFYSVRIPPSLAKGCAF